MTSGASTVEAGATAWPSQLASVARVAVIHGTRSLPIGLPVGALLGWAGARPEDSALGTRESVELTALLVGFVFVPAAIASLRAARLVLATVTGRLRFVLLGPAVGTSVALAWALLGSFLAYFVGGLWGIDLAFRPILVLGAGYGLVVGATVGLLGAMAGRLLSRCRGG